MCATVDTLICIGGGRTDGVAFALAIFFITRLALALTIIAAFGVIVLAADTVLCFQAHLLRDAMALALVAAPFVKNTLGLG